MLKRRQCLHTVAFRAHKFGFVSDILGDTHLNIVNVTQLEKDTILVCYDSKLQWRHVAVSISACSTVYMCFTEYM